MNRIKHIYKYLTSESYRTSVLLDQINKGYIRNKKKNWAHITHFNNGGLSWTEYYDHDGSVYTIYDQAPTKGFQGEMFKEKNNHSKL